MKKVFHLLAVVVAMVAITGCKEKKSMEMLAGEWSVMAVGEMAVPESVGAFIGFNLAEKMVYGSTGCNRFAGELPATVSPEKPMFGALGSTRMMCIDMTVEDALLPALGEVVDFKVDGDTLCLLNAAGQTVVSLQKQ